MAHTTPIYLDDTDLVRIAQGAFSDLPEVDVLYQSFDLDEDNYNKLLLPRLQRYGRNITFMIGDGSCYWRSFSHQCWNTQEYHLFPRFATAAHMRANIPSYSPEFYEEEPGVEVIGYLDNMDKIITEEGPTKGTYPPASEIEMKASCNLFGVKIERLFSFGDRVIDQLHPISQIYHKEIGISCITEHADSMFIGAVSHPDAPPISKERFEEIRQTGCVTDQDFMGRIDFPLV